MRCKALRILAISALFLAQTFPCRADVWSTPNDPYLSPASITVNGTASDGTVTILVYSGATVTLSAASHDDDTDTPTEGSPFLSADSPTIDWGYTDGTMANDITNSGDSNTWTAPTLDDDEDSRTIYIYADPDDLPDDVVSPDSGDRDDDPGVGLQVTIVVSNCKVTNITCSYDVTCSPPVTPPVAYFPIGTNVTFTAVGADPSNIQWSGGGTPPTGTGATFTTQWAMSGTQTVTATCEVGPNSLTKTVKACAVTSLELTTTGTAWPGNNNSYVTGRNGEGYVGLQAHTDPDELPAWNLIQWTGGYPGTAPNLLVCPSSTAGKTNVTATIGASNVATTIVVVWAEQTAFQIAPPTPGDSTVAPPAYGTPANLAFNGVLMQFTVTPLDAANYGVTFDIKRTVESIVWYKTNGVWKIFQKYNKPAGSPDDETNTDEMLIPSPTGHIYVQDHPGSGAAVPNSPAFSAFAMKGSFVEWVQMTAPGNVQVSDNFQWHSFVYVQDDGTGAWQRVTGQNTTNEIAPGAAIIDHVKDPTTW